MKIKEEFADHPPLFSIKTKKSRKNIEGKNNEIKKFIECGQNLKRLERTNNDDD